MPDMTGASAMIATREHVAHGAAARLAWAQRLFAAVDGRDVDILVSFLTEDARFTFGNMPTIVGRAAVRAFSGGPSPFARTRHSILGVWAQDDVVIVELSVEYARHDGTAMTLPGAAIYRLDGGLIRDYRIFTDTSPLFP
jgi:ketosteroid isomerase-like protein